MTDRLIITLFSSLPILLGLLVIIQLSFGLVAGYIIAIASMIISVLLENTLIKRFIDKGRGKW